MTNQEVMRGVLRLFKAYLQPLGFKKKQSAFIREIGDVLQQVHVQTSRPIISGALELTVNVAVLSLPLSLITGEIVERHDPWGWHWNQRIGFLMPIREDLWWVVKEDYQEATNQILKSIEQYAIPALHEITSTADLIKLWQSDRCPGLSNFSRLKYLNLLSVETSDELSTEDNETEGVAQLVKVVQEMGYNVELSNSKSE